jgi:HD-like signal output (HDOD) protein
MISLEEARDLINEIETLPTLPALVEELLQRLDDPNTTFAKITAIIERDPAMNARVLRLVNSAFYGLPRRISSLNTAVGILGFNSVRNLVLATSFFNMFRVKRAGFDSIGFWMHSLTCGVACKVISAHKAAVDDDSEFVFGLLHDVGKILMAAHMEDALSRVLGAVQAKDILFHEAEAELLQFTHQDLGAALAQRWRFPEPLIHAIRFHHRVDAAKAGQYEASLVHLGDVLARAMQVGWYGDARVPPIAETAWTAVGLDEKNLPAIMDEMHAGLLAAEEFIELIRHPGGKN